MKNRFCKAALVLLMAVCLFLSFGLSSGNLLPLRVHAAEATITMTASSGTVSPGQEFTVTVRYACPTADSGVLIWNFIYDSALLTFLPSGGQNEAAGVINEMIDFSQGQDMKNVTVTYRFRAKTVGEASFSIRDLENYRLDNQGGTLPDAIETEIRATRVSIVERRLSGNADLNSLSTSSGTLTPTFSANVTSYRVEVPHDVAVVYLYYGLADPDATVALEGADENLEVGDNRRILAVTAPDGTVKRYTVNIVRAAAPNVTAEPTRTPDPATPTRAPTQVPSQETAEPTADRTPEMPTTPEQKPTETAAATETPAPPSQTQLGEITTETAKYTVYDVSVYLAGQDPALSGSVSYADFMLGRYPCVGIPLYPDSEAACYIVCAEKENAGEKLLYVYDCSDGSMQRYYGMIPVPSGNGGGQQTDEPGQSQSSGGSGSDSNGNQQIWLILVSVCVLAVVITVVAIVAVARRGHGGDDSPDHGGDDSPDRGGDDSPDHGGDDDPTRSGEEAPNHGGDNDPGRGGEAGGERGAGENGAEPESGRVAFSGVAGSLLYGNASEKEAEKESAENGLLSGEKTPERGEAPMSDTPVFSAGGAIPDKEENVPAGGVAPAEAETAPIGGSAPDKKEPAAEEVPDIRILSDGKEAVPAADGPGSPAEDPAPGKNLFAEALPDRDKNPSGNESAAEEKVPPAAAGSALSDSAGSASANTVSAEPASADSASAEAAPEDAVPEEPAPAKAASELTVPEVTVPEETVHAEDETFYIEKNMPEPEPSYDKQALSGKEDAEKRAFLFRLRAKAPGLQTGGLQAGGQQDGSQKADDLSADSLKQPEAATNGNRAGKSPAGEDDMFFAVTEPAEDKTPEQEEPLPTGEEDSNEERTKKRAFLFRMRAKATDSEADPLHNKMEAAREETPFDEDEIESEIVATDGHVQPGGGTGSGDTESGR